MKVLTRIVFVDDENEKFFGEGPYRLLQGIEEKGSLRAAALDMGMSYTKALKLVNNAEKVLGFPFITRVTGGKSGGGSCLTEEGRAWIEKYAQYREACRNEVDRLYREFYGEQ